MNHIEQSMLKYLLLKRYKKYKEDVTTAKNGTVGKLRGKIEFIEELYEYFGFGDVTDKTPTPDEIMIGRYKSVH